MSTIAIHPDSNPKILQVPLHINHLIISISGSDKELSSDNNSPNPVMALRHLVIANSFKLSDFYTLKYLKL